MHRKNLRKRRKKRISKKVRGSSKRPRICVFRSNKHIYAQVIDDEKGKTLLALSDLNLTKKEPALAKASDSTKVSTNKSAGGQKGKKSRIAELVGQKLGERIKAKKISKVVFDRSGYRYRGRVKILAEGVRKAGIEF